jgi:colanic acid/amylovoran biosynthesis protein
MHVVVENTVCLNTGDAAILIAIGKIIRQVLGEGTRIYVFDSEPEAAARLYDRNRYPDFEFRTLLSEAIFKRPYEGHPVKNAVKKVYNGLYFRAVASARARRNGLGRYLLDRESRRSLEIYESAASVVTTGGTYLVEKYNLRPRIDQFRIDGALGKDTVFFTQSLGPFEERCNRAGLKPVFDRSPLILLRDERSLSHVSDLVADPSKCHVVADAVFALADTHRIRMLLDARRSAPATGRVGISVRNWSYVRGGEEEGMSRYIDAMRRLTAELVRQGKAVTFVSTCQGVPEYGHDDSLTAASIVDGLDPSVARHVTVDAAFHTPEELMELAKGFDFVVATRMHMMILSLCVGTPVLPIAYEFKTKELAARVGLSEVLLDIDTLTGDEALATLKRFSRGLDAYRRISLEATLRENASALSSAALFAHAVHR